MSELIGTKHEVLDKGWIQLIDFMPHPATGVSGDMAIINAARVSFMGESKGEEADKKLLFYLMRNQHNSPFEMVQFKFRVHAPLVTYWQWIRHRTFHYQSINSQSGRYTPFEEDSFHIPKIWRKQSASNKQGSDGQLEDKDASDWTRRLDTYTKMGFQLYKEALEEGIAKEQARLFLPAFGVYYTWVVSVDALNLMNFLKLRMASDAQYEIRVYAEAMYHEFFKPLLPQTAEAFELYVLRKSE